MIKINILKIINKYIDNNNGNDNDNIKVNECINDIKQLDNFVF